MYSINKKNIYLLLFFLTISIIYLLRFSTSTSPLFFENGNDSAVFLMLGKFFFSGYIPYRDFFDHKGPILILIEGLGYFLVPHNGRLGVFILQVINLFCFQIIVFKTARLILSPIYSFTTVIVSLIYLRFVIEGGNLSEEYSLCFIAISVYITVRYYLSSTDTISSLSIYFLGICAAAVIWIRLNNTASICACLLFILITQIQVYKLKNILGIFFYFLLGLLTVTLPIILYFIYHRALYDLVDANFIFNIKYLEHNSDDSLSAFSNISTLVEYLLKSWLPFSVLIVGICIEYKASNNKSILLLGIFLLLFNTIATQVGNLYYHYMMVNISCFYLGGIFILKWFSLPHNKWSKILPFASIASVVLLVALVIYGFEKRLNKSVENQEKINTALQAISFIPKEDYNSVYTYLVRPFYLPNFPFLPSDKYFIQQEWHSLADPNIKKEINHRVSTNSPKWIISQARNSSTNKQLWQIIDSHYVLFFENDTFQLYKLI